MRYYQLHSVSFILTDRVCRSAHRRVPDSRGVNLPDRVLSVELVQSPVDSSPPISSCERGLWGT